MICAECEKFPGTLQELVGWRHFHGTAPCWWLVKEVYARHLNIALPVGNLLATRDKWASLVDEHVNEWRRVDSPAAYNLLLMMLPWGEHIAICDSDGSVVHYFTEKSGVVRTPAMRLEKYARGYFAYIS